mgnify:CR=1 FL=1
MTAHKIFDGAFVMYSDMHLKECTSYFQSSTDSSLLYIDHCREGRIESEIDNHAYSYLQENEMRVDDRRSHSGRFCFPLCHYHGMTLGFDLDIAVPALKDFFGGFSVDLYELQKKYCNDKKPFVIHNEPGIEHIFSELYHVREKRKPGYMKIKMLELLLFLSDLNTAEEVLQTDYYNQNQVALIKAVASYITEDLTTHHTIEQLSQKFKISTTALKKCFRGVYGTSVYSYLRTYRLQVAQKLLLETELPVTEIASKIGYENPNKFTSAFKEMYGSSPTEFRKSVRLDRNGPYGVAKKSELY